MLMVKVFRGGLAVVLFAGVAACGLSRDKNKEEKGEEKKSAPAMAADALIGSCQAKDDSSCEEYRNRADLKDEARSVELTMTKGACESDLKNGVWREGKACEPKGEIGHCTTDKAGSLKRVAYSFKGDEEMASIGCKDLMEGKWESGLADDAILGSCTVGSSCTEIRNNKQVPADSRVSSLQREEESCQRLEGTFAKGKGCDGTTKAKARCTDKGEYKLTSVRIETDGSKQAVADAKELCSIGEGKFEELAGAKSGG
ncbi:MAG: hypothetical protein U0271_12365 [Polyangiaceae bacterium]